MSTEIDIEVRNILQKRRGDWPRIAASARVSHSWISQFVRGKIPNPGIETLKSIRAACAPLQAAEGAPEPEVKAA